MHGKIYRRSFWSALFAVLLCCSVCAAAALHEGERGENIKKMQLCLITCGFLQGEADGVFGAATKDALMRFQKDAALEVDGVCGEQTMAALTEKSAAKKQAAESAGNKNDAAGKTVEKREYVPIGGVVKKGTYGDGVREVQEILIEKGYLQGEADGVCGEMTFHAIRGFQNDAGLFVDGIVGGETYAALRGKTQATDSRGGRVVFVRASFRGPFKNAYGAA